MDKKTIILVIILSLLLGVAIFLVINFAKGNSPTSLLRATTEGQVAGINQAEPTATPRPTLPPLPENANLQEEIQKIEMPDFSSDYQNLKNQIN